MLLGNYESVKQYEQKEQKEKPGKAKQNTDIS